MRLLERSGSGARLTEAGLLACERFEVMREIERLLRRDLAPYMDVPGEVSITCPDNMVTFDNRTYTRVISEAAKLFGGRVHVETTPVAEEVFAYLKSLRSDIIFTLIEPLGAIGEGVRFRRLLQARYSILCTPDHPFAKRERLDAQDLCGHTVYLPGDDEQNNVLFAAEVRRRSGGEVRFASAPSTPAMKALLASGTCVGFSAFTLQPDEAMASVPFRMDDPATLGVVWMRSRESASLLTLIERIVEIFRQEHAKEASSDSPG